MPNDQLSAGHRRLTLSGLSRLWFHKVVERTARVAVRCHDGLNVAAEVATLGTQIKP